MSPVALDPRRTRLLVGLIAIAATGALAALLVLAAGGAYDDGYELTARTARTGFGLDDTSEVKIRGVTVGSVAGIELLDDGTVELTLDIDPTIRIPVGATATIEPLSVFGPKFVDVRPGPAERTGPFHGPGDALGGVVEPTELAETLDGLTTLLDEVDPDDVATIVSELARGVDGLGEELGASIVAANDLAARVDARRPVIDELLNDARDLAETLASRTDELGTLASDGHALLRTIDADGEAFGDLLLGVSELATRGDDLIRAVGDDLDPTLLGLERGAGVLREQLLFLPDFVAGLDATSALLGTGLLQWDRGEGQWGGLGHGIFDFAPCGLIADAGCPPRPGYEG